MERTNQPLTNEAARKLMALDVQDKEILTYEKLDEWYTAWGGCWTTSAWPIRAKGEQNNEQDEN